MKFRATSARSLGDAGRVKSPSTHRALQKNGAPVADSRLSIRNSLLTPRGPGPILLNFKRNSRKSKKIAKMAHFPLAKRRTFLYKVFRRAEVAQLVEQGTENPRVGSSILSLGTMNQKKGL